MASFADVESALEKFDGRNKPVNEWFDAYEGIATAFEFSAIQMNMFCRRLLFGTARAAVEAETGLVDFTKLKTFLVTKFGAAVNGVDVYRQLMTTVSDKGETAEDFAYRMNKVAKHTTIPESVLVGFIVAGLQYTRTEKVNLWGETTFDGLIGRAHLNQRAQRSHQQYLTLSQPHKPFQ